MGCTLNYTAADHRQAMKTWRRESKRWSSVNAAQRKQIRSTLHRASAARIIRILEHPESKAYPALARLLANSVNAKHMTDKELKKVPEVFNTILKRQPDAMGLFEKPPAHRGPGSSPVQHHYEVFSAAAMMQKTFRTMSGKPMTINMRDRIDFGVKFAAGYGQPVRYGTIEADILIHKNSPLGLSDRTVAIDAKHSKTGSYGITEGLDRELAGIRVGLRDGKFDEFCFMTNGEFGGKFKNMVQKANREIARDYARTHNLLHANETSGVERIHLTREELKSTPQGKINEKLFDSNTPQVNRFIKKHEVPQVDLCQYVKFPGT